jgi:hypothetical protein
MDVVEKGRGCGEDCSAAWRMENWKSVQFDAAQAGRGHDVPLCQRELVIGQSLATTFHLPHVSQRSRIVIIINSYD